VIAQVNPRESIIKETRLHHSTTSGGVHFEQQFLEIANYVSADSYQKRNMYYQLTQPINLIARVDWTVDTNDKVNSVSFIRSDVVFGSSTISALQIKSYIYGFRISRKLIDFLKNYFTHNPFVVPAEMVRSYSFPNPPNDKGIDTQVNITITHATEADLLFFHSPNDTTVSLNPKYKDVSLKMLDQSFPDTAINTMAESFFRSQLQANYLGVGLQCIESFETSYQVDFSGKLGERFYTHTDITNFCITLPLEIPNPNALFAEGAHSNQNTVISLTGNAIKQGEEEVYHNISETNVEVYNKTCPTLCLVSNTFWVFSISADTGLGECHYEINKSWNQFFAQYYPDLYAQMMTQVSQ
jgi:hypothetical protein